MKILNYKDFLFNKKINENTGNVLDSIESNSHEKIKNTVAEHMAHRSIMTGIFRNMKKTDEQIIQELIKTFRRWYPKRPDNDSAKNGKLNAIVKNQWSSIIIYNELDDLLFQVLKNERELKKLETQITKRQDSIDTEKSNTDPATKDVSDQRIAAETEEISKTSPLSDEIEKNIKKLKPEIEKLKAKYREKEKQIKSLEDKKKNAVPEPQQEQKK